MQWTSTYLGYVAAALAAILPIVNPLGAVPLVVSAAGHLPEDERRRQIGRACGYTFMLMSGFLIAGSLIMDFFGISLPGMRIAGGMIVAVLGFQMLFPNAPTVSKEVEQEAQHKADIAFTPLAMPGLSGPGTFAVVMSLSSQATAQQGFDRIAAFLGVLSGIIAVVIISWLVLRAADRFNKVLGPTGTVALTRLTGFLMICIGVQFIINGLGAIMSDPSSWSGLQQALGSARR
jgi:multiple antibiotic resistance protein